jgi:hypothetical protein
VDFIHGLVDFRVGDIAPNWVDNTSCSLLLFSDCLIVHYVLL